MRLISEIDAGGDFRGLIEKELKLRLDLPVAEPSPATGRGGGERERAGGGRAANLRRLQDRKRPGREVLQIMRRKALDRLLLAALLLAAPAAAAQPMMKGGGGGMPDLSQIVGRPLPDRGMPTGTVSVRVARKMPANAVAGSEVSAIIKNAGGDLRRRALKTDDSGRVLFEGMAPGDEFRAEVNVDGEHLQTDAFTMPSEGGIRTMLISGVAGGGRRRRRGIGGRGRRRRSAAGGRGQGAARLRPGRDRRRGGGGRVAARRDARGPFARRGGRADRQPPRSAGHREQAGGGRRQARRQRRDRHRAVHRLARGQADGLRGRDRMARPAPQHVAVRDARQQRRARRDPRTRAHRRSVRGHDRRGRADRRPDGRGPAADPRVPPAREHVRTDVRPGAGRAGDPAAHGIHGRAAAGERAQDRRAAGPRRRRARPDRPQALAARRG